MHPEFFTRTGAFIFALMIGVSTLTAAFTFAVLADIVNIPDPGVVVNGYQVSPLVMVAIIAIINASLDVHASTARPHGPGTAKWAFVDAFYSILKALPLVYAASLWVKGQLTGRPLEVALVLATVVFIDLTVNWIVPRSRARATTTLPPGTVAAPAPATGP